MKYTPTETALVNDQHQFSAYFNGSDLFPHPSEEINGVRYGVATEIDELCAAYTLVHEEYCKLGLIKPNGLGMRYGFYQFLPGSVTYVAESADSVVGTGSLVVDSKFDLPCYGVFADKIDALRSQGRIVGEATMLGCIDSEEESAHVIAGQLNRFGICYASAIGVDDYVVVVHPKHVTYWRDKVGMEMIGEVRTCEYVEGNPGALMRLDLRAIREGTAECTRAFQKIVLQNWISEEKFISCQYSEEVATFLPNCHPDFLNELNPWQLEFLKELYPAAWDPTKARLMAY